MIHISSIPQAIQSPQTSVHIKHFLVMQRPGVCCQHPKGLPETPAGETKRRLANEEERYLDTGGQYL